MGKKPFLARSIPCYIDVFRRTAIREKRFTCVWRAYDWFPGLVPRPASGDVRVCITGYRVKLWKKKPKYCDETTLAVSLLHPFAVLVCPSCYPSPRSRHEPCSPSRPVSRFSKQKYHIVRRVSATPRVLSQEIKRTYDAVKFSPLHDEYGTYVHHDYQYCRCTCRLHVIIVTRRVTRPNFAAAFAITLIKRVFF